MEGHGFERDDRFARLVHRFNRVLETLRGDDSAELTVGPNDYSYSPRHSCPRNAGNTCFCLCSARANADALGLPSNTQVADIDIVTTGGEIKTG